MTRDEALRDLVYLAGCGLYFSDARVLGTVAGYVKGFDSEIPKRRRELADEFSRAAAPSAATDRILNLLLEDEPSDRVAR
jgi:hypothetical protein